MWLKCGCRFAHSVQGAIQIILYIQKWNMKTEKNELEFETSVTFNPTQRDNACKW